MTKQQFMQTIPKREKLYLILAAKTRLPYAECNPETFDDENFYFTSLDKATERAERLKTAGMDTMIAELKQNQFLNSFSQCYAQGINSLVFQDGDTVYRIELSEFVKKRDPKDMPDGIAPVENPELMLSMIYYLQEARKGKENLEANREKINELAEEALANLTRATFMMPMMEKEKNEQGQRRFIPVHVTIKDKTPCLPIFSDIFEFQKSRQVIKMQNIRLVPVKLPAVMEFLQKFKENNDEHTAVLDLMTLNLPLSLDHLKLIMRDFGGGTEK